MTRYWFKPKRYGYGATPATWQGWSVTTAGVATIVAAAVLILQHHAKDPWAWIAFFAVEGAVVAALCVIARNKTKGGLRWRWGNN